MKKLSDFLKKKVAADVDRTTVITAGLDMEQKHSICLQRVNHVWCICVHKHTLEGGRHYSEFSDKSLVSAMPIRRIVELCLEKALWWKYA